MKMIRWQGFIAFIGIIAAIALVFYLFAASLMKWAMVSGAESVFNAQADIQQVSVDYSPLRVSIYGMSVGDESEAMVNLFEFEEATVSIDLLRLMMGQVIVEQLNLQGLAFATQRQHSGLLESSAAGKQSGKAEPSLSDDFKKGAKQAADSAPDAKTLLAREPLKTDAAYNALTTSIEEKTAYWQDVEKTLPNDDTVKAYEEQVKALFEGDIKSLDDFKQRKAKLDTLKKAMRSDKQALTTAKNKLQQDRKSLKQQVMQLKNAPQADYQHLKNKYGLNAGGVANISALIFGDDIGHYSHMLLHWYNKAKPVLARVESMQEEAASEEPVRAKGRFIRFYEANPQPDFIIEQARLSLKTPQGLIQGEAKDVTHQQAIINRPTTLTLSAEQLKDVQGLQVDMIADYRTEPGIVSGKFSVAALHISEQQFSASDKLSLSLDKATGVIAGEGQLSNGRLTAAINSQFTQAQFSSDGQSSMARELGAAIESMHDFDLNVALTGAVDELDIDIRSNIDNKLKDAFTQRLSDKQKEWQQQLDGALNERMNGYLAEIDPDLGLSAGQSMDESIAQLDELSSKKLDDYEAQQTAKAKLKADAEKDQKKKELKNKLKSLF